MPDFEALIREHLRTCKLSPVREAEIVDEMAEHLRDRYQALCSSGASEQEALHAVVAELGQRDLGEELRAVERTWHEPIPLGDRESAGFWSALWRDVRYGFRVLRLNPGFTTVCVLSLALGIGANTAIFQLIDAVRLRTLPVKDPQQLANLRLYHQGRSGSSRGFTNEFSYAQWEQIRNQQQGFTAVAAWGTQRFNLNPSGEARYTRGVWVSGSFFDVLGVHPALGRLVSPPDDEPGCGSSGAVLSYAFWQREYGGKATALGQKLMLEGHPFEIIGVTPPSFFGLLVGETFDVAIPLCVEPVIDGAPWNLHSRTLWFLDAVGRLKPGWTLERATAQLAAISPGVFAATLPPQYGPVDRENYLKFRLGAEPAAAGASPLRRQYETPLWLLLGISGLVLLIACANLANLMMARAGIRRREMAVRLALGASRGRLVHQLFTEALLLAFLGALCGTLIAQVLSRTLVSFLSTQSNRILLDLRPDWRVLAFTAGVATLTCILFGLAPAVQTAQTAPAEAMKAGGRGVGTGVLRFGMRRGLVVTQVAVSLVLLAGALLFVRTFNNLLTLNPGFDQEQILVTDVQFSSLKLPVNRLTEYRQELLARVRAVPGVVDAAENVVVPVSGSSWNDDIKLEAGSVQPISPNFNAVSSRYFATMGTPLLTGRDFNAQDTATSPRVAIVNETFAKKIYGGGNPVGRTFKVPQGANKPDLQYEVVGLVKDTKYNDLRTEFPPIAYVAISQFEDPEPGTSIMVRSGEMPAELIPALRKALSEMNPALVLRFSVFKTQIREGLTREWLMATLAGFFGAVAVLLAVIGLYGVISYMVVRRRNEIGIRIALGATRGHILIMVVQEAAKLLTLGVAIGIALTLAAAPVARALLFGLKPTDTLTLMIAAVALAAVAVLASFLPAHRAATLDPMVALRDE